MTDHTSTFDDGTTEFEPILVNGYESSSVSGSIVRRLPFSGTLGIVLRPGSPGAGQLRALWGSPAEAKAMRDALNAGATWTVADTELTDLDMTFIVNGTASYNIDPLDPRMWWTVFDYQEVTP